MDEARRIVSLTPQGIGVVEGVMTLVLVSLGVPASKAAVIAVAFRGLTFWVPLAIGFVLLRWEGRRPDGVWYAGGRERAG